MGLHAWGFRNVRGEAREKGTGFMPFLFGPDQGAMEFPAQAFDAGAGFVDHPERQLGDGRGRSAW